MVSLVPNFEKNPNPGPNNPSTRTAPSAKSGVDAEAPVAGGAEAKTKAPAGGTEATAAAKRNLTLNLGGESERPFGLGQAYWKHLRETCSCLNH